MLPEYTKPETTTACPVLIQLSKKPMIKLLNGNQSMESHILKHMKMKNGKNTNKICNKGNYTALL